jgi:crossover junction endodeoxyribonuclease RuvC
VKIVGIDTGQAGAVAVIEEDKIRFFDKYVIKSEKKSGGIRTDYDIPLMVSILKDIKPDMVYLELAQSMPKQGVASTFKTGFGFGLWVGLLAGLGIPYELIRPQTWQVEFFKGRGHSDDTKSLSYQIASSLYPTIVQLLKGPRGGLIDGRCDALLIAEFAKRRINNNRENK